MLSKLLWQDEDEKSSTGWFQEEDSRVIKISCENLLHNQAEIHKFKLILL